MLDPCVPVPAVQGYSACAVQDKCGCRCFLTREWLMSRDALCPRRSWRGRRKANHLLQCTSGCSRHGERMWSAAWRRPRRKSGRMDCGAHLYSITTARSVCEPACPRNCAAHAAYCVQSHGPRSRCGCSLFRHQTHCCCRAALPRCGARGLPVDARELHRQPFGS